MARIQLSGMISDIKGSIGGTTYQLSRVGHIAKSKAIQPKANTRFRNNQHARIGNIAQLWRSLTVTQRSDWTAYAIFRDSRKGMRFPTLQSGYDLFRSINFYYLTFDSNGFLDPIMLSGDVFAPEITSVEGNPNYRVTLNNALISGNEFAILKMTNSVNPALSGPASRLKVLDLVNSDNAFIEYQSRSIQRFGNAAETGDTVFVSVASMSIASGYITPFIIQRFIVV